MKKLFIQKYQVLPFQNILIKKYGHNPTIKLIAYPKIYLFY